MKKNIYLLNHSMDKRCIFDTNKEAKMNDTNVNFQNSSFKNSNSNSSKLIKETHPISLKNNQKNIDSNKNLKTNMKNPNSSRLSKKSYNNKNTLKTKSSHYSMSFDSKSDCFLFENNNPIKKMSTKLNNSFTKDSKEYYHKYFGKLIKIRRNNHYYEIITKNTFEDNNKMPLDDDKNVKFGNIASFQGSPSQNDFSTKQKISNSKEESILSENIDRIIFENNNSIKIKNTNKRNNNISINISIMNYPNVKNNFVYSIKKNLYDTYFRNKMNKDKVICKDIIKKLFIQDKDKFKYNNNLSVFNKTHSNFSKQNINNSMNHIFKKRKIDSKINNLNINKDINSNIRFYYSNINNINKNINGRNKTNPNYCYVKSKPLNKNQVKSFSSQNDNNTTKINEKYNYSKKFSKLFKFKNYNTISNSETFFPVNNFNFKQTKNNKSTIYNKSRIRNQFFNKNFFSNSFNSQRRITKLNDSNKLTNDSSNKIVNSNNRNKLFYEQFSNIFSHKNNKAFTSRNVAPFAYENFKDINQKKEQTNLNDEIKNIVINDYFFKFKNGENKMNNFYSFQNNKFKNNILNKTCFYYITKRNSKNKEITKEKELREDSLRGAFTSRLNNSDEFHRKYFSINNEDVVKYSIIKNNIFNKITQELSLELNNNKEIKNKKGKLKHTKKIKQMLINNFKNINGSNAININRTASNFYIFKKSEKQNVLYRNENFNKPKQIYVKKTKQKI